MLAPLSQRAAVLTPGTFHLLTYLAHFNCGPPNRSISRAGCRGREQREGEIEKEERRRARPGMQGEGSVACSPSWPPALHASTVPLSLSALNRLTQQCDLGILMWSHRWPAQV